MDPFLVLGVPRTATKEEIKKAFRKRAMEHHPDRHASSPEHVRKGAEATFRALNDAYQVLMDDSRRHAQSSGAGGFKRHGAPYGYGSSSSSWGASASQGAGSTYGHDAFYSPYGRRRRGLDFVGTWRAFTSGFTRREGLYTLFLGGVVLVAGAVLEPMAEALWKSHNAGKLFHEVERDHVQRQLEQLEALRQARRRRQAAAEADAAATAEAVQHTQRQQATLSGLPEAAATVQHQGRQQQQGTDTWAAAQAARLQEQQTHGAVPPAALAEQQHKQQQQQQPGSLPAALAEQQQQQPGSLPAAFSLQQQAEKQASDNAAGIVHASGSTRG